MKLFIGLVVFFLSIGFVVAASNPGHPASQIDPGIFAGGGGFIFPWTLVVNGTLSVDTIQGHTGSGYITLLDSLILGNSRTLTIRSLVSCDTIDTDANGQLRCGTDAGTVYTMGTGLTQIGNSINIAPSYQLPQGCNNGQVPKSNGIGGWVCADDSQGSSSGGGNSGSLWNKTQNTVYLNDTVLNVSIGSNNADSALQVIGDIHTESLHADVSVATDSLDANRGYIDDIVVNTLTAKSGLTINTPIIYMNATNGDYCELKLVSARSVGSPSGTGSFVITCYPALGCGNYIIERSIGEQCDPPGRTGYNYSKTGAGWDCSAYYNFYYVALKCDSSCKLTSAGGTTCMCEAYCTTPTPPHTHYSVIYNCAAQTAPQACASGER
jgi:hypothetical protein